MIQLIKETDVLGEARYFIMSGDTCVYSTDNRQEARLMFEKAKTEVTKSEIIDQYPKP